MKLYSIDSIDSKVLEIYHQLREHAFREDNSFIADSPKVINLLLESDIEIKSILATQVYYDEYKALINSKNINHLYLATKEQMQNIVGHKIHHNAMMHGIRPTNANFENLSDTVLMLDEITSTENIGAIARSAAALGVNSYLVPKQGPHPYSRRALRVSMGYVSKLSVHLYDDIFDTITLLKEQGYTIYAAEVNDNSIGLSRVIPAKKWVLLMGHEGKGISDAILGVCDYVVSIEMVDDIKSFNVATAASIMMYHFKTTL